MNFEYICNSKVKCVSFWLLLYSVHFTINIVFSIMKIFWQNIRSTVFLFCQIWVKESVFTITISNTIENYVPFPSHRALILLFYNFMLPFLKKSKIPHKTGFISIYCNYLHVILFYGSTKRLQHNWFMGNNCVAFLKVTRIDPFSYF